MKDWGCCVNALNCTSMHVKWHIVQTIWVQVGGLITQWKDLFVVYVDHVSYTSSVKGVLKLRSWQSDDVAEGCGRCTDRVSLLTAWSIALHADWTPWTTWLDSANQACVRLVIVKRLRHMRTKASLKIASVIQPGRRWDSHTKLTSPILLHTFSDNNGLFQVESGSGGLSRYSWLFITCRRRWTWTHGKTAFWEADWKGGALKIMDVCALCNQLAVAVTASFIRENTITDATECMAWTIVLLIDVRWANKQIDFELCS